MAWQDRDLKRLKLFMEKCGLELAKRPYSSSTGAAEYDDARKRITIFLTDSEAKLKNKTELILTILHELGHHLDKDRFKEDKLMDEALIRMNSGLISGDRKDIPKKYRRKILQLEKSGLRHWVKLKKTLDLEIPLKKIELQQKIDIFHYQHLYDEGSFPDREKVRAYKRSLKSEGK